MARTKQTAHLKKTLTSSRPTDLKSIIRDTPHEILYPILDSLPTRKQNTQAILAKLPDPRHCIRCHGTIPEPQLVKERAKKNGVEPSKTPCKVRHREGEDEDDGEGNIKVQHRESEWQCEGEGFSEYGCCGGWEQNGVQGYCHEGQHSTDPKDRILWQGLGEELEDCEDLNCALKILDGLVESDDEEEEESFEDEPEEQKSEQQEQLGESRSDLRRRIAVRSLNSRPGAS
ncbi:hypothetical protein P7C70_g3152, partial [Phenoliferia sp. Uapishka_3]